jgi:hypothetical protein
MMFNVEEKIGPNKEKVIGEQRKLHNEKVHNLYPSPATVSYTMERTEIKGV